MKHKGPDFNTLVHQRGRPDIILTNRHDFLNTIITEGDITTSDHIPILMTIATRPILREIKKTKDYRNADWDKFREVMDEKITRQERQVPLTDRQIDKTIIDEALRAWTDDITETIEDTVPTKEMKYFTHPRDSDLLKLLEMMYTEMKSRDQWTIEDRQVLRHIQEIIKEEATRLNNQKWSETIDKLQDCYGDSAKFWGKIRKLMGGRQVTVPYILDSRGNKITDDINKEEKFREIWMNIFRISDEENANFDADLDRRVTEFMDRNDYRITPFEHADLDRLDPTNYMTRPTNRQELRRIINDFKNGRAPGKSGINKVILINLPDTAIDRLADIFNLTISMGYFPVIYKNGIIILIPKPGKDARLPFNYRPITLLEVPGKILERLLNSRLQRFLEENNILN